MVSDIAFAKPNPDDFGPFGTYIRLVPEGGIHEILSQQLTDLKQTLSNLSESDALRLHPPYTWTLHQVLGHVTDCERVFGYRALRLARQDATPLPSFHENEYMKHAHFDAIPLAALLTEFELLRRSHLLMISHFNTTDWSFRGTASKVPMTTAAMVYVIAGHTKHQLDIIKNRLTK